MFTSWKIGRVAGIDLYLHPTLLLAIIIFGAVPAGLPGALLVSAVFGCVLLHELGHALMARRLGIRTQDITLYPIGGVARLERMPRAPGAELLIALAGPAVNVAIFGALRALLGAGLIDDPGLLVWAMQLMMANLILAVFNLVPAFPMDGGRVLRALLSGWVGRARATDVAGTIGQTLAVLFGLYGLLIAWQPLWALLAAFIFFVAGREMAQVRHEERQRNQPDSEGIWITPPGHYWVDRGNGVWQLVPLVAAAPSRPYSPPFTRPGSPWA